MHTVIFRMLLSWPAKASLAMTFLVLSVISGCVPSPNETVNTPPIITDLRAFSIPQNDSQRYFWHHFSSTSDSAYLIYLSPSSERSSDGFSPIWKMSIADTAKRDSLVKNLYISDSIVVLYCGKSDSAVPRQILLHDTLKVGAKWNVADHFITSNGTPIQIIAEV